MITHKYILVITITGLLSFSSCSNEIKEKEKAAIQKYDETLQKINDDAEKIQKDLEYKNKLRPSRPKLPKTV